MIPKLIIAQWGFFLCVGEQLPNVTSDERINITIRAVGSAGIGIPIYMMEQDEKLVIRPGRESSSKSAKIWGIVIGVSLSMVLIFGFVVVFRKLRKCTKNRQNTVNHNQNMAYDQSMHPCSRDTHEMQTLIPHTGLTTAAFANTPNGNAKHGILDSFTGGETRRENGREIVVNSSPRVNRGMKTRSGGGDGGQEEQQGVGEEEEEDSSLGGSEKSENTLRLDECCEAVKMECERVTKGTSNTGSRSRNINGNGNVVHMNGSVKLLNFLPQHSTTILPPNQQTPNNNNVNGSNDEENLHETTADSFNDDSQQELLGHSMPILAKNIPNRVANEHQRCNDIKYHNGSNDILSAAHHNGIAKCDDTFSWIVNNVAGGKNHQNSDNYRRPIVGPNG